jgi:hypothetical protein
MTILYPKMLTGTDGGGRTTPLVYPFGQNHPKQGTFVIFKSAGEEAAYLASDNSGVPASTQPGIIENRHHT